MKNIHISLTGVACSGKTTLMNALAKEYPEFKVQNESVRYLKNQYGMDFRSGNAALQLSLLHLQTKYLLTPGYYLLDRSSVDSWSYTQYYKDRGQSDIESNVLKYVEDESKHNAQELIDLIIYLRPGDFKLVEDGVRITDKDYIRDTDLEMEKTIKKWGLENKVIEPHGSVEERVEYCKKYIDELIAK